MDIFTFILARNSAGGGGTGKKGSAKTPNTTIIAIPEISVSNGRIYTTASSSKSITPTVVPGYVEKGTPGTVTVSGGIETTVETLDENFRDYNIRAGVSIFGVTGNYVGGDGGIVTGSVKVTKTNGYGLVVQNCVGVVNGFVTTTKVNQTTDGARDISIPTTPSGCPYCLIIKPYDIYGTKINSVTGNTGGTAYITNTLAYVPVYSGDTILVNMRDN